MCGLAIATDYTALLPFPCHIIQNRIIAEPKAANGLRHPVKKIHTPPSSEQNELLQQQRFKYAYIAPEGRKLFAGQRLAGVPAAGQSPLAIARGRLGSPRKLQVSEIWERATRDAVEREKARGGQPTPSTEA